MVCACWVGEGVRRGALLRHGARVSSADPPRRRGAASPPANLDPPPPPPAPAGTATQAPHRRQRASDPRHLRTSTPQSGRLQRRGMGSRKDQKNAQKREIKAQREIDAQRGVRQAMKRAASAASRRMKNGMNAAQQGVELCQESKSALTLKMIYFLLVLCGSASICAGWVPMDNFPFDISVNAVLVILIMLYPLPLFACFASNYIYLVAWNFIIIFWPRWIVSILVREKSLHDYVSQNPAVKTYTTESGDDILTCTKDGLLLWLGYLNIIIAAHKRNRSWCGSFSEEHLKLIGNHCRIVKSPTAPGSFGNLLLDLSRLATLLLPYYSDIHGVAELYMQQLYDSMTNPPVNGTSSKCDQDSFIKYLTQHLALCSAHHRKVLLTSICMFVNSLGPGKRSQFVGVLKKIQIKVDWREEAKKHILLAKVLYFDRRNPGSTDRKYGRHADEFFRFMRNFYAHGVDCDFFTKQHCVKNIEDLDYVGIKVFSSFVVKLSYEIHMRPNMAGLVEYAWKHHGV